MSGKWKNRPSSVIKAKADIALAELAERGRVDAGAAIDYGEAVRFPMAHTPVEVHGLQGGISIGRVSMPDSLAMLAWLLPEQLRTAVHREIDAVADDGEAVTDDERAQRVATLKDDLLAIERGVEHFFGQAIASGASVTRDENADPRAILGVDSTVEPQTV